jgi:hypothetical protein
MSRKFRQDDGYRKQVPLWKWVLVLLLVVAMPLYFSYYRMSTLHYIIKDTAPAAPISPKIPNPPTPVHPAVS